jgi:hypothetical protein
MTISQIAEQLQLALANRGVYVKLAIRPKENSSSGKDVDHAKSICSRDRFGPRCTNTLAGSDPSPFHAASVGLSMSPDPPLGSGGSAFQSSGGQ